MRANCILPWQRLLRDNHALGAPLADGDLAITCMRPSWREETLVLSNAAGSTDMDAKEQDVQDEDMGVGPPEITARSGASEGAAGLLDRTGQGCRSPPMANGAAVAKACASAVAAKAAQPLVKSPYVFVRPRVFVHRTVCIWSIRR